MLLNRNGTSLMNTFDRRIQLVREPTRFASNNRLRSTAIVLGFILTQLVCMHYYIPYEIDPEIKAQFVEIDPPGDLALFRVVSDRLRSGTPYYLVFGEELRSRGYDSRSVMNWRTPLLLWLLSRLPDHRWEQTIYLALSCITVSLCFLYMEYTYGYRLSALHALIFGPNLLLNGYAHLLGEVWAGVLISLSIVLAACQRYRASAIIGVFALFLRELVAPYALVCMILAHFGKRTHERNVWLFGFAIYAIYYVIHSYAVLTRISDLDHNYSGTWIQSLGLPFVLQTFACGVISLLPAWAVSLAITLALMGLTAERGPLAKRLLWTITSYAFLFCLCGKHFNTYWGLLYSPLLSFGLVWCPGAIMDLLKTFWLPPDSTKNLSVYL